MTRFMWILGVVGPTSAAALFELGLWWAQDRQRGLVEPLCRIFLMATAALGFSWGMLDWIDRAQKDAHRHQLKFEALFQNSVEAILVVSKDLKIVATNPRVEPLLGLKQGTSSLPLCSICAPRDTNGCPHDCPFKASAPRVFFETNVRHRDGRLLTVAASVSRLPGEIGSEEMVIRLSDISQFRAQEDARISRALARRALEAQEQERHRLARELHDGVGQGLFALRLASQNGQPVEEIAVQLMEEIDRMAKDLWPPLLDKLGLEKALLSLFQPLPQVELIVQSGFERLPGELEAALYRISQEAVNNALRHGKAQHIKLNLRQSQKEVLLDVCDDGEGFQPDAVQQFLGLGLLSMQERSESMRGAFSVDSAPGSGTRLCVRLPL